MAAIGLLLVAACSDSDGTSPITLLSPESLEFDAQCQTDTIRFKAAGHWTATTDSEWMTLTVTEGRGEGEQQLPLYIQQNDDESLRRANVTIKADDGTTLSIPLRQLMPSENGNIAMNLPKNYGLGWGYDLKTDIADIEGLRGQIFDAAALKKYYGDDIIQVSNATSTQIMWESGQSHEELETKMSGRLCGKADLLVASGKVEMQYSKQISEKKDRRYIWARDFRQVKLAGFGLSMPYGNSTGMKRCTTYSFRNAVSRYSARDIVNKYGTHLVTTSALGGKLDYYFTLSQSVKTEVEQLVTTIQVKVLFVKKSSTSVEEHVWQEIKTDFEASFQLRGGGAIGEKLSKKLQDLSDNGTMLSEADGPLFEQWDLRFADVENVDPDDLVMVNFQVMPIWEIIEPLNPTKAAEVEEYVMETYLKK